MSNPQTQLHRDIGTRDGNTNIRLRQPFAAFFSDAQTADGCFDAGATNRAQITAWYTVDGTVEAAQANARWANNGQWWNVDPSTTTTYAIPNSLPAPSLLEI